MQQSTTEMYQGAPVTLSVKPGVLVALYSSVMESGKSETAKVFRDTYGFRVMKFAGPLKDMTRAFLKAVGVEDIEQYVEGPRKMEALPGLRGLTARRVMQTIGTEWGRQTLYPDFWCDIAMVGVKAALARGENVVLDDLRFPNEFVAVKAAGAVTVRIIRPDAPNPPETPYERQLDGHVFDQWLWNDSTIAKLHKRTSVLASCILAGHRA